jgi:hypothetical protein
MAMRRRDALVEKLRSEQGLSKEEALDRAMSIMRDNGRGDWRAG